MQWSAGPGRVARRGVVAGVTVVVVAGAVTACATDDRTPPLDTAAVTARAAEPSSLPSAGPTTTATRDGAGGFDERAGLTVAPFLDADADLDIDDQSGDGVVVRVDEVRVTRRNSFLAVFTSAGDLLGSAAVTPTVQPVTVPLQRAVTGDASLVAVLFADDGDDVLDVGVDAPVADDDGDVVRSDFRYTAR